MTGEISLTVAQSIVDEMADCPRAEVPQHDRIHRGGQGHCCRRSTDRAAVRTTGRSQGRCYRQPDTRMRGERRNQVAEGGGIQPQPSRGLLFGVKGTIAEESSSAPLVDAGDGAGGSVHLKDAYI